MGDLEWSWEVLSSSISEENVALFSGINMKGKLTQGFGLLEFIKF